MAEIGSAHTHRLIPDLGRFWTMANVLSMVRLVLILPITYLVLINGPILWVLGLAGLAVMTDWFDGRVARWSHTVSEWGKVLDPLADKLMAGSVALALVLRGSLPGWFFGVVVARDVLIVLGGIVQTRRTGRVMPSLRPGKWAVGFLALTILAALLQADPPVMMVLLAITTALLVYSFLRYALRFWHHLRTNGEEDVFGEEPYPPAREEIAPERHPSQETT